MSRFRLRVVDLEAGISRRALASGVCAAVEAEGGDEVFVELEPDAVAGVDVGPIDQPPSPARARLSAAVNRVSYVRSRARMAPRRSASGARARSMAVSSSRTAASLSLIHISEPTRLLSTSYA